MPSMPVTSGLEQLLASARLRGCRVGLVCHPASIDAALRHAADRFTEAPGITLAALFGPQHGIYSDAQDNMIETPHTQDAARGIPVYSLYSETRMPTGDMLSGLDVLVIDLQDVGTRVYTYIYTMANCLRACRQHDVSVIVCDRPNPIGGTQVEGPVLEDAQRSFVGQFPIPLRHGMTIGELARLFNEHFAIGAQLEVMAMAGWDRSMYSDATALPWVPPSPNLPTLDSVIVYPGGVLVEGTNLSEGRGTTRPFELIGAPWVDGRRVSAHLNAVGLPGVYFRSAAFEPTSHKHAHQTCGGCQVHVQDRSRFNPVLTATAVLQEFRRLAPERFAWSDPPYEYERGKRPIDILSGSEMLRQQLESDTPLSDIGRSWEPALAAFKPLRERFLLY